MLVFFFWASVFGAWLRTHHQPFLSGFSNLFMSSVVWGFLGFLTVMYLCIFFYAVRQVSNNPPIRFNRQRREVVYVPYRGAETRYVAWESVIACISVGRLITQYAVMPEFKLMMGLRDANNGDVLWVSVPSGNLDEAVSEWEAIRSYMEEGPSALPPPQPEEFEEGTVAYFHMRRKGYHSDHSFFRYVAGFLMIQFLSGWTLPCYISGWVNNRTKAGFPKEVQKWSQSLPTEQHAMPSEELLRESTEIREAFAKGQNLLDYFKVKFAEPTQKSESAT
ncbi:DUF6708 domain-containing protein [Pseudomonas sp. NPDC087342]|uniref:DUF6708 domain-containing protein n=1 Tax=Pseudomonas sp. NPDC087342 TaxID=3364437 RepID=UPI003820D5DA